MASEHNLPSPNPDRNSPSWASWAAFRKERRKGPLIMLGTKRAAGWELLIASWVWRGTTCGGCDDGIYPGQLWVLCETCGCPHHVECIPPRADSANDDYQMAVVCRGCRS